MRTFVMALAAASMIVSPALAKSSKDAPPNAQVEKSAQDASIPFANLGGIRDWRADSDDAVYLQDTHGRWYRAELFMPAFDLPFVQFIGIDSGPTGTLDKFGAIYVDGERYPFRSFVHVSDPTKRKKD